MAIELFVLPDQGGLYPRRVLIYLAEKNILISPHVIITSTSKAPKSAPGEPPNTLPILSLGQDTFIRQSVPIIEYFEDLCDSSAEEISKDVGPKMRGRTPDEQARTKVILDLADEATKHFEIACHKGSAMFSLLEKQNATASGSAFATCKVALEAIESHYKQDERLFGLRSCPDAILDGVTIADCVLFALLQFSIQLYSRDLTEGLPMLKLFYNNFKERDSAKFGERTFPKELKMLASHFIKESASSFGSALAALDITIVYVKVLVYFVFKQVINCGARLYKGKPAAHLD